MQPVIWRISIEELMMFESDKNDCEIRPKSCLCLEKLLALRIMFILLLRKVPRPVPKYLWYTVFTTNIRFRPNTRSNRRRWFDRSGLIVGGGLATPEITARVRGAWW